MPHTIMVIDDNPLVRDVMREILQLRGYSVLVAEDGHDALRMFAQNAVDAALIDMDMPEMNGIEVCRALCNSAAQLRRTVLVWVMTGVIRPELTSSAAKAGAMGVLPKPFTMAELVSRIEQALDGRGRTAA